MTKKKTFIQIGSNTGNDDFFEICKKYQPSKIILIEPFTPCIEQLRNCYSELKCEIYIENVAIVDDENIETVILYERTGAPEHHTVVPLKGMEGTKNYTVAACTFTRLVEKYNISDIGILHIDTEGNDARIINSIDFDKNKIDNIIYEYWPFSADEFIIQNKLNGVEGMIYIERKLNRAGYELITDERRGVKNILASYKKHLK